MHNFRNIEIWKRSIQLCKVVFKLTKTFPFENRFDLTQQIIRSAVSIPSNIAEGSSRKSDKEFSHYLDIALGSSFELETQLIIAKEVIPVENFDPVILELNEIQRMTNAFKQRLIDK